MNKFRSYFVVKTITPDLISMDSREGKGTENLQEAQMQRIWSSIQQLAFNIDNGFNALHKRLDTVEKRITRDDGFKFQSSQGTAFPQSPSGRSNMDLEGGSGNDEFVDSVAKKMTRQLRSYLSQYEHPLLTRLLPSSFAKEVTSSDEFCSILMQIPEMSDLGKGRIREMTLCKIRNAVKNRKKVFKRSISMQCWQDMEDQLTDLECEEEKQRLVRKTHDFLQSSLEGERGLVLLPFSEESDNEYSTSVKRPRR